MDQKKVLLIDDSPDHLLICSIFLEGRGYQVQIIDNPDSWEQLYDIIFRFAPDIIFTDYEMAGMRGDEIVALIKGIPQFDMIPVIYFSALADIGHLAIQDRADAWLPKPLQADRMLTLINTKLTENK